MSNLLESQSVGENANAKIPASELVTQLKRCKQGNINPLSCSIIVNKLSGKSKKIDEKKLQKRLKKQSRSS